MPYEIRLQYVQEPAVRIKCLKIVKKIAAFPCVGNRKGAKKK